MEKLDHSAIITVVLQRPHHEEMTANEDFRPHDGQPPQPLMTDRKLWEGRVGFMSRARLMAAGVSGRRGKGGYAVAMDTSLREQWLMMDTDGYTIRN